MTVNGEGLRYSFISERDAQRIYNNNPEVKPSPKEFCPTCLCKRTYTNPEGDKVECDCELQLQLYKHYITSGIGSNYQRLGWDDYYGDEAGEEICKKVLEAHQFFIQRGAGLLFHGAFGVGKTMSQMLLAKDFVKLGYNVFCVKFTTMVEMFTSGWRDQDEKNYYQRKINKTQILFIDDLGKEMENSLTKTILDDVIRGRVQEGRSTCITTNLSINEIRDQYGEGIESLLTEMSIQHEFLGKDYRREKSLQVGDEILKGITRPIV